MNTNTQIRTSDEINRLIAKVCDLLESSSPSGKSSSAVGATLGLFLTFLGDDLESYAVIPAMYGAATLGPLIKSISAIPDAVVVSANYKVGSPSNYMTVPHNELSYVHIRVEGRFLRADHVMRGDSILDIPVREFSCSGPKTIVFMPFSNMCLSCGYLDPSLGLMQTDSEGRYLYNNLSFGQHVCRIRTNVISKTWVVNH